MFDLPSELRSIGGSQFRAGAGETIFRREDPVRHLHLIEAGCAHLIRDASDGARVVMQRAMPGMVLAEASLFSERYHCDGVAVEAVLGWRVSMHRVRQQLKVRPEFARLMLAYLAREVQRQRVRAEILSLKTVSSRLNAWLEFNGPTLPPRGTWKSVAEDIGVSAEAFYRELGNRSR